jgi:hypothetical protein
VCVLSDLGSIGGWNNEKRWSRIDGEELAMAANDGSRMERNAGGFERKPTDTWGAEEENNKLGCREEKIRRSKGREQQVRM